MDQAVNQAPPGWAELLDASLADVARGNLVPAADIHDAIRTGLAELEIEMNDPCEPRAGSRSGR